MDDEGVVVVVALAVAGEIPAARLQDDDVAAVDHARRDRRALGERAAERAKDLVDDRLLAGEFAAPRAAADRAPDDIVVARFPQRGAVALGNLGEDVGHELSVARERGHCGSWTRSERTGFCARRTSRERRLPPDRIAAAARFL